MVEEKKARIPCGFDTYTVSWENFSVNPLLLLTKPAKPGWLVDMTENERFLCRSWGWDQEDSSRTHRPLQLAIPLLPG